MERKRILQSVVPSPSSPVLFADFVAGTGAELFRAVCEMDMEGVVAKRTVCTHHRKRVGAKVQPKAKVGTKFLRNGGR